MKVMIINPDDHNFLKIGKVLVDGAAWKVVDLGYGQPTSIQAKDCMEVGRATRMLRQLVRNAGVPERQA